MCSIRCNFIKFLFLRAAQASSLLINAHQNMMLILFATVSAFVFWVCFTSIEMKAAFVKAIVLVRNWLYLVIDITLKLMYCLIISKHWVSTVLYWHNNIFGWLGKHFQLLPHYIFAECFLLTPDSFISHSGTLHASFCFSRPRRTCKDWDDSSVGPRPCCQSVWIFRRGPGGP